MNQIYIIAVLLIISGPVFLYLLLMKFSEKKIQFKNNGGLSKEEELIPLDESDSPEEQLKWNLPEFAGTKNNLSDTGALDLYRHDGDLFHFNPAAQEGKDYIGHTGNLQDLSKKFLEILSRQFTACDIILYLRDGEGIYQAVLKKQGRIHISGDIIKNSLSPEFAEFIEDSGLHASRDGLNCHLTIENSGGMAGILHIQSHKNPLQENLFPRAAKECRRFGELLYQSFIFEQATKDLKSGLLNGMKFQNDIEDEFQMRDSMSGKRQLILAEMHPSALPSAGRIFSEILHDSFRLYRIASGTIAVLGPDMNDDEYGIFMKKIKNKIDMPDFEIYTGRSVLRSSIPSSAAWISLAERDLTGNMNFPETDAQMALN